MNVFLRFALLFLFPAFSVASQQTADSLLVVFEDARSSSQRRDAANRLMTFLYEERSSEWNHPFTAHTPEDSLRMLVYLEAGTYFYEHSAFKQSVDCMKRCYRWAQTLHDTVRLEDVLHVMSASYTRLGMYNEAFEQMQTLRTIAEQKNDPVMLGRACNSMANICHHMRNDSLALTLYIKAIDIARKQKDEQALAVRLGNLGGMYADMRQPEKALPLLEEALALDMKNGWTDKIPIRQLSIGNAYLKMNEWGKAENYYRRVIEALRETTRDKVSLAIAYGQLGWLKQLLSRPDEAETYYKEAEKIAKEIGALAIERSCQEGLYTLYKEKNPALALGYLERNFILSDSLYRMETTQQMNNLRVQYETAEKELQIQKQQSEIEQTKQHRTLFALSTVFALLLCGMLYLLLRQRRKRNRQLAEANATKDKLFSIISHDLKSPVIAQKATLDTLIANYDAYETDDLLYYLERFRIASESQMGLLQNLLSWAQVQTGKAKFSPLPFDITHTIAETANLYAISSENKNIRITTEMPERCYVVGDREMIATVLRNLINNAVKFSHPDSEIHISLVSKTTSACISIKDSGTGMTERQVKAIRAGAASDISSAGTQGEKGSGLGLVICKDFLRRNGSHLVIESRNGEGTCMSFELNKVNF